jgi:hypothetical protein
METGYSGKRLTHARLDTTDGNSFIYWWATTDNAATEACCVITNPLYANSSSTSISLDQSLGNSLSEIRLNSAALCHDHKDKLDAVSV